MSKDCIECGKTNPKGKRDKMVEFCSTACRSAFHNRRMKRGALVLDVVMLMRSAPKETAEWPVRLDLLLSRFEEEDKAAGRPRSTRRLFDVRYDTDFPHV